MERKTKEVLDSVYRDKISAEEAAKILNITIDSLFELADKYKYISTLEDVRKANEIAREGYIHIKLKGKNNP